MKNYRQKALNVQQNQTLDEMEDFAENAHSSILYILLNMFGATDEDMSFAASHVGVCSGMVTQLRGMAHMASQVISIDLILNYLFLLLKHKKSHSRHDVF